MKKVLESVINFSEGRNLNIIRKIESAVAAFPNVKLLHRDMGYDANRTVITIAGEPQQTLDAAFQMTKLATSLIDMRLQHGEHPRIGATDLIPIVPLVNMTLAEAKNHADILAKRVATELGLPVFLYAENASNADRCRLPFLRRGDYEGLSLRIQNGFLPDHGPNELPLKSGAVVIGARTLMLAFNINLKSRNVNAATRIAGALRSSGRIEILPNGMKKNHLGLFKGLQAKGWLMKSYNCAQITTNIHDIKATPPHLLYNEASKMAKELGEELNGCELIGLSPIAPLLEAGIYSFNLKEIDSSDKTEDQLLAEAIYLLGLNSVRPFNPKKQIIEKKLPQNFIEKN